jgi:hypothetical protein
MIGIRTGGILSGGVDVVDIKERIINLIETEDLHPPGVELLDTCMSSELHGDKGSYVVIAGVFNYWGSEATFEFARLLSVEFGTEVMVMAWNEMSDDYGCNIFLDGEPLNGSGENPIGNIIRRMT